MLIHKKGQSTLEYILVLTAIVIALIFGTRNVIGPAVSHMLDKAAVTINAAADRFADELGGP